MTETTLHVRVPTPLLNLGFDQGEIQRRVTEWLVLSYLIKKTGESRRSPGIP
jgi:hypothetical protein